MYEVGPLRIAGADEAYQWLRCGEGRGVIATRPAGPGPQTWELAIGLSHLHGYGPQVQEAVTGDITDALKSLVGEERVRAGRHHRWLITGVSDGPELVRVAARVIDQASGVGPEAVRGLTGKVMRLARRRLEHMGFSGTGQSRHRLVDSGDAEIVTLHSHGGVIVELSLVPAGLLQLWDETVHYMRTTWQDGGCGISTRLAYLTGDDLGGGISPLASRDPTTAARILVDGICESGIAWYDRYITGDPLHVRQRDFDMSYPPAEMRAAWMLNHPRHPGHADAVQLLREQLGRYERNRDPDDIEVAGRLLTLLAAGPSAPSH